MQQGREPPKCPPPLSRRPSQEVALHHLIRPIWGSELSPLIPFFPNKSTFFGNRLLAWHNKEHPALESCNCYRTSQNETTCLQQLFFIPFPLLLAFFENWALFYFWVLFRPNLASFGSGNSEIDLLEQKKGVPRSPGDRAKP